MHCCNSKWRNGTKAPKTVERRTTFSSNLRSLAEVEHVEEEIQDPRNRAGYSKYAVGGAGVKRLHHVPADKAACSFACNQCTEHIEKSQGYRCQKINIFCNKGNHKSKTCSFPHCCYSEWDY